MLTRFFLAWLLGLSSFVAVAQVDTTTPIFYIAIDVDKRPSVHAGQTLRYPEICVTLPEVTNRQNLRVPASSHQSNGLSGPGRVMYRNASGVTRTIWDAAGRIATPADLRLSPDGTKLAFTIYTGTQWKNECGSRNLTLAGSGAGAHVAIHDLLTHTTTEWRSAENENHALTPAIINQGGALKVMFASDRAKEYPPQQSRMSPQTEPNLQTYIANLDGSNAVRVGPHDFASAYGFYQLKDGRVISSSAQWVHDASYKCDGILYANGPCTLLNMWEVWGTDPWGGNQETLFGAHWSGKAMHFFGQLSDGRICTTEYYRGNYQNGAGNFWCWTAGAFTIEGVPVTEATTAVGNSASKNGGLVPRDLTNVTPWARSEDDQSYFDAVNLQYQGRVRDPVGLPNGALMFSYCKGTCNNQGGWTPDLMHGYIEKGPRGNVTISNPIGQSYGIYKLPANKIPSTDYINDPVKLVDDPDVFEYGAIYGGPYADVYGQDQPDTTVQPLSGDGACYLQIASQQSDTLNYDVLHKTYHFAKDDHSAVLGKEIPGVSDSDVKYIRISQAKPTLTKSNNFAGVGKVFWSAWGIRAAILGDAPVESDGSAKIKVPCDMPWLLSGLNANHEVIKRDMRPQSLRPGTTLTCGGCHLHNDVSAQPDFEASVAAGKPATDLTGAPTPQPEYSADIAPIIHSRCGSCHTGAAPAGGISFTAGVGTRFMLTLDYKQTMNPAPLQVWPGSNILGKPHISWLIDGSFAARSRLYWYFKNARTDYRTNSTAIDDFDFNAGHPTVNATHREIATIRDWIDTGALYEPSVPIPAYMGGNAVLPPRRQ